MRVTFLSSVVFAVSVLARPPHRAKPAAFFLAGDSTTAIQSTSGGGWGVGFLSFLKDPAWGIDFGHNGATTVSFVAGGDWANVTGYAKNYSSTFDVYVTIQFGHNDQKATANISLDEYQTNLQNMAKDVKSVGGTPLLVTPLTRRDFTSEHNATDNLHDQRLRTIAAAEATNTTYIDLNKYSMAYVDGIGANASYAYNLNPDDYTHLNDWGSVVFGRMVADLLLQKKSYLEEWFIPNNTLSYEIWHGIPA